MFERIQPARIGLDRGVPFNADYGDVYASRDGALGQARHVFLAGNGLPERWRGRDRFVVLETGFGLGTNFLATWRAWRDDPARPRRLHFVSIEKHPVDAATLVDVAPQELRDLARALADAWPLPLPGLRRLAFDDGAVVLTLAFGDVTHVLPQLVAGVDAFYLDGFAPDRNPDMWSPRVLKALGRIAREGATAATWCAARAVRDGLVAAGFDVALQPGFARKREMLVARFAPRWRVRREDPPAPRAGDRHALIVGSGLAGASCAFALAREGWRVDVVERAPHPAAGASALPWGIAHPQVSADDNAASRLSRAGFFIGSDWLRRVAPDGDVDRQPLWRRPGLLQVASDTNEAGHWQRAASSMALPVAFARFVDRAEASALAGVGVRQGGWWFESGTIVAASRWCRALLATGEVRTMTGSTVARLVHRDDAWEAQAADGRVVARAPVAIVAAAGASPALLPEQLAPVAAVRGRIALFDVASDTMRHLATLRTALGGPGYVVRTPAAAGERGLLSVGATYETALPGAEAPLSGAQALAGNLQRLANLVSVPEIAARAALEPVATFDATRCVARDRLPLAGAVVDSAALPTRAEALRGAHLRDLPRVPDLFAAFALGSRGLTLAPLVATWIAAQLEGDPWPLERDLAARIDVGRFALDALRHGRIASPASAPAV